MYIPLRVFSPFSIGFGAVKTDALAAFARAHGLPAAGVCDHNTLGGALTLSKDLAKAGIQPLVGLTLDVRDDSTTGTLVMFATRQDGYDALLSLVNARNLSETPGPVSLDSVLDATGPAADGLVVLSGGPDGLLEVALDQGRKIHPLCTRLVAAFGERFYLEIQRPDGIQGPHEATLVRAAHHFDLGLVATNEAHYPEAADRDAHDAFLCIADKTTLDHAGRRTALKGRHLVSPDDMEARFADMPQALANTVEIARRAAFFVEPRPPQLPAFPVAEEDTEEDTLRRTARDGLARRLEALGPLDLADDEAAYHGRLKAELDIIIRMGFAGYFLIVADFIGWARDRDIPVGPGRGSGAGSLVAWALGITNIDPLRYGLIFERFLNPERVSMPDFDIDFCQERREEVIAYVRERYGADRVAHIAAFGTLQARAVVRDVARVAQVPYREADRFAKMIPANPSNPITLAEAMEEDTLKEELERADGAMQTVFRIALKLEGLYRHVSTHAAGIIISDRPVAEVVPVHRDQHGQMATSFEMKATEAAGLVKFDFLGLKNLDIVQGALDFIQKTDGHRPDLDTLVPDDPATFAALRTGDGFGVFQLESAGMRAALREVGVETMEELIALISLYRPGPMDQIRTYADVKHDREPAQYAHPALRPILDPTNGVMIYQEQVMAIAQDLAGYAPGEADLLRRAMGKKIQAEMDAQSARFRDGAAAGWTEITLDDGTTRTVHALSTFPALDGSGRRLTIAEAADSGVEIAI